MTEPQTPRKNPLKLLILLLLLAGIEGMAAVLATLVRWQENDHFRFELVKPAGFIYNFGDVIVIVAEQEFGPV